jgi:hypothetical protein
MLRPEVAKALDAAAAEEPDTPTRPEMVRRIIVEWLQRKGYLPK